MKKLLALLLAMVMVFAVVGCAAPATEKPADDAEKAPAEDAADTTEAGKVGVSMPTQDLQRWNQDGSNMENKLKEAGYEVNIQYAANDIQTQVSQIENMINDGVKCLVVASIDGSSLGSVMASAKEAGIPVIAYDRLIMDTDAVSYYATFDNYSVGVKQGEYIETAMDLANAGDKVYNIEYITGDPGDNNINFFFDGAMSVLQKYVDAGTLVTPSEQVATLKEDGSYDKAVVATANWATDAAQSRFETILGTYYADANLDIVLASNDSTAQGVANALASSYDGTYPVLTGQDCDIVSVQNMAAEKQSMSVFKDTRTLADKVVGMVDAIMKGSEPEINDTETYNNGTGVIASYLCEPVVCTPDKIAEILIESGYYTQDQVDGKAE